MGEGSWKQELGLSVERLSNLPGARTAPGRTALIGSEFPVPLDIQEGTRKTLWGIAEMMVGPD